MSNILVIGAGGFVGSYIFNSFNANGAHSVVGLDNFVRHANENEAGVIELDCSDADALFDYVRDADIVMNLAAINGTENFYSKPMAVFEASLSVPLAIYDCLQRLGDKASNKTIFLFSSGEVYNHPAVIPTPENVPLVVPDIMNPRFSYGGGKIVQDLIGRYLFCESGFQTILIRPHNVYGPNMGMQHVIPVFLRKAKKCISEKNPRFEIQGSGEETRAFCHIADFFSGLNLVLDHAIKRKLGPFEIFNIGTQEEMTIKSLAVHCCDLVGVGYPDLHHLDLLEGSTPRRCPSIKKLQRLGYKPIVDIVSGLEDCMKNDNVLQSL